MDAIKIEGLTKKYKDIVAVDNLNLTVKKGELFSLLGVNGAGKTTTIKMLSCLTMPTDGDAVVGGYSITKESEQVKRLIGVSPQETAVAPNLSVKENLELICGIHGFSKEKTEAKIRELGAIPAEKGYDIGVKGVPPYPASLCVSINDEVIHGVPSKHKIILLLNLLIKAICSLVKAVPIKATVFLTPIVLALITSINPSIMITDLLKRHSSLAI